MISRKSSACIPGNNFLTITFVHFLYKKCFSILEIYIDIYPISGHVFNT